MHVQETRKLELLTAEEYMASNIPGRTEFIGGIVYEVSPKKEPHVTANDRAQPRAHTCAQRPVSRPSS